METEFNSSKASITEQLISLVVISAYQPLFVILFLILYMKGVAPSPTPW